MRLLTLKEAQEATGICVRTWRYYVQTRRIDAVRGPRNKLLIPEEELKRFIQSLPKAR
ncbi:MAG: helix-turn-helix domain-containing protein [Moorella sp. (in: firmicutes)]